MPSKRALIVDDSRSARAFLARLLERQGLEVDGVGSASEAYAYLRRQLPDVLFLDHLMPEADGFDVLKVLKKDVRTRAIPVLMYTSQQGDDYLAQARTLGAVGVLPKQLRAIDVTGALDQLGLRAEPEAASQVAARHGATQHGATQHGATQHGATQHGATQHGATQHGATQSVAQATTVVDTKAPRGEPTHATTVIDVNTPRPGAAAARATRGSVDGGGEPVSPELRSLLEALVREQGLAVRQQVSQLVTQQGERMANELRAIRREVGDMNERLAAGASAVAITGTHRTRAAGLANGTRMLLWAGLVLAVITAAVGATWLLRPDLWSNAGGDAAHAPAASPTLPLQPSKPVAGVAGSGQAAGGTPLFAAPEQPPRGVAAPAEDPAARAGAPPAGTAPEAGAAGNAAAPTSP